MKNTRSSNSWMLRVFENESLFPLMDSCIGHFLILNYMECDYYQVNGVHGNEAQIVVFKIGNNGLKGNKKERANYHEF
jgi:hypothetical protein